MTSGLDANCFQSFDQVEEPDACKCKGIVLSAYRTLKANGVRERDALQICARVLRYHHPSSNHESKNVVECWVFEHSERAAH
jgi:hypothetical protein